MEKSNKHQRIEIKAEMVSQPIGDFLIASIKPEDLVNISYADVRRIEGRDFERYLGIQRPLSKKRVKEIRDYIHGVDASFPTSIILSVDSKCAEYDEKTQRLILHAYEPEEGSDDPPIAFQNIANILDGQHRIASFLDENRNFSFNSSMSFELNISVFVGIDLAEQANIFATVNFTQTRVNKSLMYDLMELARSRSPHKTCHLIAVAIDKDEKSPLYRRIKRLGVATPGREYEPLTQAVLVESLVKFISTDPLKDRKDILDGTKLKKADGDLLIKCPFRNLFIDKADETIFKILFNYFAAVSKRWPHAWQDMQPQGNLLPKSNSFRALMRHLKDEVYINLVGEDQIGDIPLVEDFLTKLKQVKIDDSDFTTRNFAPGSGGESKFYKLLKGQISKEDLFKA